MEVHREKIQCPCCGGAYLEEYEICSICSWENDPIQLRYPDKVRGDNGMTLTEARRAFREGRKVG